MSQKPKEDICASRADSVYSSIVSIFAREGSHNGAFLDVGPYSDLGVLILGENERIWSEYGNCAIPF